MIQFIDPVGVGPMMYQVVPGVEPECTTVELNVGKLDEVWRRDPHTYVGPGGYDIKEAKLTKIRNQLNANSPIEKPIVEAPSGNPEKFHFVDGRHRVAVFRERGLLTCPFVVPKYLADAFLRRFG